MKKNISWLERDKYFNGQYKVTTIVPLVDSPYKITYKFDLDQLKKFSKDLHNCGEFIIRVDLIKT
jgi:hypothetical protein